MVTVVRMWRPRRGKARVRWRPGTGLPTGRFPPLTLPREPGAHQAIHADALLGRPNGQRAVHFRRHPNHELPAVGPVSKRLRPGDPVGVVVAHQCPSERRGRGTFRRSVKTDLRKGSCTASPGSGMPSSRRCSGRRMAGWGDEAGVPDPRGCAGVSSSFRVVVGQSAVREREGGVYRRGV